MSESYNLFRKRLNASYGASRNALNECISTFLDSDTANREAALTHAIECTDDLLGQLHPDDIPAWLTAIRNNLRAAEKAADSSVSVKAIKAIATDLLHKMAQHKWDVAPKSEAVAIDFDAVYATTREEYEIPRLFDEVIDLLKRILETGEVDSKKAHGELETIIASLEAAKDGSYLATYCNWEFFNRWMKAYGWEFFGGIPVLGPLVKGLHTAIKETNEALESSDGAFRAKMQERLKVEVRTPQYTPPELPPTTDGDAGIIDITPDRAE